ETVLQIVWFKRDLRVRDHEALYRASARGPVLPLYITEPDLWRQRDMSERHWAFVRECLISLREELAKLGQPLVLRQGEAVDVLDTLCDRHAVETVWSHQETGNAWTYRRDQAVAELLHERGIEWRQPRQHGVVRGLVDRDGWSGQWETMMRAPQFAPPALQPIDGIDPGEMPEQVVRHLTGAPCPGRQLGGRQAAEQALHSFLLQRGANYHAEMSSPRTAYSSCSRLSAHLAWGTVSMREVLQATRHRRAQIKQQAPASRGGWGRALAAFEGRLHWHCHFMQKLEREPRLEFENMQRATADLRSAPCDPVRLQAWKTGMTGWPLVDACMRALIHTGWINFRMRALLMSVASYQLWLHWREPALHLARQFVDYEPGIHYPQAQMQSGTTGINTLRIYNPVKQSMDQDKEGVFIRTWIPELRQVRNDWIHTPWLMPESVQHQCGVRIGQDYPAPLVDHQTAAREARQKIQHARRTFEARNESRNIYERHGSRKRPKQPKHDKPRQAELFVEDT
ncbi:MAG: deoxyribodipyrimidine photo-lyase, partial [Sedimenticolaceae bacterium]